MDYRAMVQSLREIYPDRMATIDSHTGGEPTRLVVVGMNPIPGKTMREKHLYFMEHYDHVCLQITWETRRHPGVFAAFLTESVTVGAHFGLIFIDPRRYPYLCGHGTISAVTSLVKTGVIKSRGEELPVMVDTPSDPIETKAYMLNDRVESVVIKMDTYTNTSLLGTRNFRAGLLRRSSWRTRERLLRK